MDLGDAATEAAFGRRAGGAAAVVRTGGGRYHGRRRQYEHELWTLHTGDLP